MKLTEIVEVLGKIKGVIAVAVADYQTGMILASQSNDPSFDLEVAVAGSVGVMRAKEKLMELVLDDDMIHDIQVNFGNEYELMCPCPCDGCEHSDMFFYLWADRSLANLSIIRRSLFHARTLVGEN
ncbi:MAG: hypothetical protein IJR46_06970 [Neisseriaceae bacterium]|nr:hypothetical protein [Neisseriaceae bacterium]